MHLYLAQLFFLSCVTTVLQGYCTPFQTDDDNNARVRSGSCWKAPKIIFFKLLLRLATMLAIVLHPYITIAAILLFLTGALVDCYHNPKAW